MSSVGDQLRELAPALAFLLAGVPLAVLLDRLGYFEAVIDALARRRSDVPVVALWVMAAVTTVVLNLDTTIVLLTPLYLSLARRADVDPLPIVAIPLLLSSLASSVLPVSNLTTLIAVDRLDLSVADVVGHLALPSIVASVIGWILYRRRHPRVLTVPGAGEPDRRVLGIGTVIVAGLLIGFVIGPTLGIRPWLVAVVADLVLVAITRVLPWRDLPVTTAVGVAAVAALLALVVSDTALRGLMGVDRPLAIVGVVGVASIVANLVNNLPALLVALPGARADDWGMWSWLLGINAGAVLLPLGALANILWWRIVRAEGVGLTLRRYVGVTLPIALPALVAAALTLGLERWVT